MRSSKALLVVGMMSLAMVLVFSGSGLAQQQSGNPSYGQSSSNVYTDTVVSLDGASLSVPATTVYWRGGRYGYSHRPYWRPYRYGGYSYAYPRYRYGWYSYAYPRHRCWWNGYRWKCRKRVVVY